MRPARPGEKRWARLLLVYGGLLVVALGLAALRGESPFITTPTLPLGAAALVAVSLALGAALAILTVIATRWLVRRFAWARR
ncbi:MAG TPA: hypothetical protein PK141_25700, partial [Polyangiaceae bacterium]|nr:hypothetical protein [Polyangiaceae bacterium]